ncbi:hypothetical protein CDO46_18325 [Pigmentiphaga sp. NML030171]|nr:hypothetical protein CDO46_18325 [Pigmentiphaga sp. NML030171]
MKHPARPAGPGSFPGLICTLPLTAVLAACGGGGEGGGSPPPAPPAPPPGQEITQPITEMPTSSHTGDKLAAFVRLNEARLAAGVGAVKQNAQLDAAAQAHATYQVRNYVVGHGEDPNKPWFTGTNHAARAIAQGYSGRVMGEVITHAPPGTEAIESFLHSVYHLYGLLEPRANQIGLGIDQITLPGPLNSTSITLGATAPGLLPVTPVWHWPVDRQTDVAPRFLPSGESPNPAPDLAVTGTPIMFCGSEGNYAPLHVLRVAVRKEHESNELPLRLLRHSTVEIGEGVNAEVVIDSNLGTIHQGCIFLLPIVELESGKTYEVRLEASQAGKNVEKTWTFSTRHVH